jgi:flagellar biosynthesis activator protein FlaF
MYSPHKGNHYEKLRWKTMSGREIEAAVLHKAALNFRRLQGSIVRGVLSEEGEEALRFNRKVWEVLRAGWQDPKCHLPIEVRQNLLNLSIFIAKAELEFRAQPCAERLAGLIQVNETLASGLEAAVAEPAGAHR